MDTLTSRESLFVAEYIQGKSAEAACVAAGYSEKYARKNAHLLLKRAPVAEAVAAAKARIKEQSEMTAERLLAMFVDAYDKAIEWKQSTGAVRAGEMIGKLTGLVSDRLRVEVEQKPSVAAAIEAGRQRVAMHRPLSQIIDSTAAEVSTVGGPGTSEPP